MITFNNIAYGSNLHPIRLRKRCPNASLIGTTMLQGRGITFHKQSLDGSGKCDVVKTENQNDTIFVAVYKIPLKEKSLLDRSEGLGNGYEQLEMDIKVEQIKMSAFLYVANHNAINKELLPYNWYKVMVILGAKYHKFPASYIDRITKIPAIIDQDNNRANKNWEIVRELKSYNNWFSRKNC